MSQATQVQLFKLSPTIFEVANDAQAERLCGMEIRVLTDADDAPWFVARDVLAVLGIANISDAMGRLEEDERKQDKLSVVTNDPSDDLRKVNLVNEPGLYSLIMLSRKPEARAFKRWVTHEVLPAIRKTGRYAPEETAFPVPTTFPEALELAARQARELERSQELLGRAHAMLGEAAPKVQAFDELMDSNGSVSLAQAAQLVGLGRQSLIDKLASWKAIMVRPGHSDHLRPYQHHVTAGRFVTIAQAVPIEHRDGTSEMLVKGTTRVTAKGVEWIRTTLKSPPLPLRRLPV
jgi:anti-repressor protein